jgi:hypothetical protein
LDCSLLFCFTSQHHLIHLTTYCLLYMRFPKKFPTITYSSWIHSTAMFAKRIIFNIWRILSRKPKLYMSWNCLYKWMRYYFCVQDSSNTTWIELVFKHYII